jgi:hypothetical protein
VSASWWHVFNPYLRYLRQTRQKFSFEGHIALLANAGIKAASHNSSSVRGADMGSVAETESLYLVIALSRTLGTLLPKQ